MRTPVVYNKTTGVFDYRLLRFFVGKIA